MGLQGLLADVHPAWYGEVDPALLARVHGSRLCQRLLARWLAAGAAPHLFAPTPQGIALVASRWPRARLAALIRDLGALAFAPAIRAEIRREPVRRLRHMLGSSYLLALDQSIWDGRVAAGVGKRLTGELHAALEGDPGRNEILLAILDRQGRNEVRAAAERDDPALGEWLTLLHPSEVPGASHLPEKPATMLFTHHAARAEAA